MLAQNKKTNQWYYVYFKELMDMIAVVLCMVLSWWIDSICSVLKAFEQGKIFNLPYIPYLLRNGTWIYIVPPERPPHLTTSLEYWEPILIRIPMENMWTIVTILTLMAAALFAVGMRIELMDLKSRSLSDKYLK